ncbi:polysaccharide deacetylase [Caballeronia temeraria]|uniref:Polysaccharide deacetylase n=1 Tax=Caballeronia temeraria TaxID=1777137 RepID=A0A157ZVT9_9BURK|nr:polysaccharide deacetylase family protein [Caballeronia temeraria]SAK49576.1 polysaccharide deacetylase [Caballeronia temeraria]
MNSRIVLQEVLARGIKTFGFDVASRRLLWRDRVAVLLYHDPKPETLDKHLTYVKTLCDVIPLSQVASQGNGRPRAAITFDDGAAGNADLLPVFIKHNVRPTIFLCSQLVGRPAVHWWLLPAAKQAGIERLKRLSNRERLAELEKYGSAECIAEDATGLTAVQLEQMRPFVDFQAHTRFHPILTRCDDSECEQEISVCKSEIESMLGISCEHFAYPNGNYTDREVRFVKDAGYKTARTCDLGWNDGRSDPYRLKTIVIDDDASLSWFAAQLTGIPVFLRYLRHARNLSGYSPQF